MTHYQRMGEWLVAAGLISRSQLEQALRAQRASRGRLGEVLTSMGWVTEEQLVMCLSHQYNLPIADMEKLQAEPAAIRIVSMSWAQSHLILPVRVLDREVHVILCDPIDVKGTDEIFRVSGLRPRISLTTPTALYRAIPRAYALPMAEEDAAAPAKPKKPMKVDDLKDRKHLLSSLSEATTEPSIWSKLAG